VVFFVIIIIIIPETKQNPKLTQNPNYPNYPNPKLKAVPKTTKTKTQKFWMSFGIGTCLFMNRSIITKLETVIGRMKLEFDEGEEKFFYFILPLYAFILLPVTYCLWPRTEERKTVPHLIHTYNFAQYRDEYRLLHANESSRKRQAILTKIGLVLAWLILLVLAYRVSFMEIEYEEYDPFAVLDVDRDEAIREIKRVYHELNKKISSRSWW
jgi:hypothetical protein